MCGRSLFIFDEMDKMPVGVIEAIKPFIDHYAQIDGIDFRKSIFLFLRSAKKCFVLGIYVPFLNIMY